jgi:hypothetical protein
MAAQSASRYAVLSAARPQDQMALHGRSSLPADSRTGFRSCKTQLCRKRRGMRLPVSLFLAAWESNQPTVSVNSGASVTLSAAVSAVDASYNSSLAITFMGSEARNENI